MNYQDIEAFSAVMESRSMTQAAIMLHTSQPNISRLMSRLQKAVGFALFKRVGYKVVPTPEAEALYLEVRRSFIGLDKIRRSAHSIGEFGVDGIRIAVSMGLSLGFLPLVLQDFRGKRPNVVVKIRTSDSATVCQWVADQLYDIGLVSFVSDIPALNSQLLHTESGVCIVPMRHRLAERTVITPQDLDGEDFISLDGADPLRTQLDKHFLPDRRRLTLETPYTVTVCKLVSLGLGISIVNPLVWNSFYFPDVKAIPFLPSMEFFSHVVWMEHRIDSVLVTELRESFDRTIARL